MGEVESTIAALEQQIAELKAKGVLVGSVQPTPESRTFRRAFYDSGRVRFTSPFPAGMASEIRAQCDRGRQVRELQRRLKRLQDAIG